MNLRQLYNVRLVPGGPLVAIQMLGGMFTDIGERQDFSPDCEIDCRGLVAIPGPIDGHVHDRSPGQTHKETTTTLVRSAINGGVTTVIAQANPTPPITTLERLQEKLALVKDSPITYGQWYGVTPHNIDEIPQACRWNGCFGVKVCTANTTATREMLVDKPHDHHDIMVVCSSGNEDFLTTWHAELEARIQRNDRRLRDAKIRLGLEHHCVIRDSMSEVLAVMGIAHEAEVTGCLTHIDHLSVPDSFHDFIWPAYGRGARITCEIGPQHFVLNSDRLLQSDGARSKVNPPLRSEEERMGMEEILCNPLYDNVILATDHAPHTSEEKGADEYERIPSGMPGLDTGVLLCFDLVARGRMSFDRFVHLTSRKPAEVFRLREKGHIKPGFDADVVLIDPDGTTTFQDGDVQSKCGWTPFAGRTVGASIKLVVARGQVLRNEL